MTIAALYIDPRGPYPKMSGVECWDADRDARAYPGPYPVVAHPPCGPWGELRHLYQGQEHDCAPLAVEQVRRWGGVLEHPSRSKLWPHVGLPDPGSPTRRAQAHASLFLRCRSRHRRGLDSHRRNADTLGIWLA